MFLYRVLLVEIDSDAMHRKAFRLSLRKASRLSPRFQKASRLSLRKASRRGLSLRIVLKNTGNRITPGIFPPAMAAHAQQPRAT